MEYWIREVYKDVTYSIDMIRLDFTIKEQTMDDLIKWFENPINSDVDSYGLNLSPFKYRHMFRVKYKKSALAVGLGFNGITSEDAHRCFLEFNPNKIFQCQKALDDVYSILDNAMRVRVSRWDVAIDIPINRERIQLVKDQRKYALTMKSAADLTEYLGTRNAGGFVKLYNKTIESKLDEDITRLELTCSGDMSLDMIMDKLPRLRILDYQIKMEFDNKLSDKDKLLIKLLKMHPDMFKELDWRNRPKFEPYVFGSTKEVVYNKYCIRKLRERVYQFEK